MKKQIAVFICAISFDNQRRIIEGILQCAKSENVDIYIFSCHLNYLESTLNKTGAFQIMTLPELKKFDGAIIAKNTIQDEEASNVLIERVKQSGIAVVCLDEKVKGITCVGISDYNAQKELIHHLIVEHHLKKINYVTGQVFNEEGKERLRGYRDALQEAGLSVEQTRVFYGNYDMDSGREAVHKFLKNGELPQAIACANDNMAIGAMDELIRLGYQIPRDVRIVGFDNDELGEIHYLGLSTVDRNQEQIGFKALEYLLHDAQALNERTIQVPYSIEIRESCGCQGEMNISNECIEKRYVEKCLIMEKATNSIRQMSCELSSKEKFIEFYEALKKYVKCSDMEAFYLCMCEQTPIFDQEEKERSIEVSEQGKHFSKKVTIPLAYRDQKFTELGDFPAGEILPASEKTDTKSSFYVVAPINYKDCCFGYCVSKNSYFSLRSDLFYSWTMNIAIGLENIRKLKLLNQMLDRLNKVWALDMLTNLYNRAGFFYFAKKYIETIREKRQNVFLIFMDLDGLKQVNDVQGHEVGDQYIRFMAQIMHEKVPKTYLMMRYGGDEFVILGGSETQQEMKKCVAQIQEAVMKKNGKIHFIHPLSVSIGAAYYEYPEIPNLEEAIERADREMYLKKKQKKQGER